VCEHAGFHSASSRYDHEAGVMHFVFVCDGCGCEVRQVAEVEYRPNPRPQPPEGWAEARLAAAA
jgi:hypothetical protein